MPTAVHFVSLAPLSDAATVLPYLAETLNIRLERSGDAVEALAAAFAHRKLLLLLDNFEHVTGAAADVGRLMSRSENLHLLTTSRQPLHVLGERIYPLGPLSVPEATDSLRLTAENPAVTLFVQRAQAVAPGFALTEQNLAAVVEICRRLDGLPLALELAAAQSRLFQPTALLGRLSSIRDDLTATAVDIPDRQRSLRATIEWSFRLLSVPEQRVLSRLAVFTGGWTIHAAEQACNDGHTPTSSKRSPACWTRA
jgi:predicted ATPase